jgi:hypothetical protein
MIDPKVFFSIVLDFNTCFTLGLAITAALFGPAPLLFYLVALPLFNAILIISMSQG